MNKLIWKKLFGVTPEYDGYIMTQKYKIIKVGKSYKIFHVMNMGGENRVVPLYAECTTLKEAKELLQKKLDFQRGI